MTIDTLHHTVEVTTVETVSRPVYVVVVDTRARSAYTDRHQALYDATERVMSMEGCGEDVRLTVDC